MKPYYEHGGITIYHGDCRDVLPHVSASVLLTDPPYGDDHDTDYTRFSGGMKVARNTHSKIAGDSEPFDVTPLLSVGSERVIFGANRFSNALPVGSWLVWDKRTPMGSKGVMSDAEVAWWSRGRGVYVFEHCWDGFNRASERGSVLHPTQKPVALMHWCLRKIKQSGVVVDPYMGSGSVLEAAKQLGREAIGIEIEERYCEIAAKRLEQEVLPLASA